MPITTLPPKGSTAIFHVQSVKVSLLQNNARFFGILDLATVVGHVTTLAVGVRNSVDKTFSPGFCAGCRVFVCDNLAFRSELLVVPKHTVNGRCVSRKRSPLRCNRSPSCARRKPIASKPCSALNSRMFTLIRSCFEHFETGIVSLRRLLEIVCARRNPPHEEFADGTLWSLLNAFTGVLNTVPVSNPQQFALQTMRLNALLSPPPN
jgi:hypothetical protein